MKIKSIVILLLIQTTIKCYSQINNQFSVYYGLIDSALLRNDNLDGSASYKNNNSYEFGFKYLRTFSDKLSIETGINVFYSEIRITPAFTGIPINSRLEKLELFTIPVYANFLLGKYFYINAGPLFDFQNEEKSFDSQSGIGYGLGIGGKYNLDHFLFYINPNFKQHSFIPFNKKKYHQKLTQFGLQIGIGYVF